MKGKKTNDSRDRKANHGNHTNDNKRERESSGGNDLIQNSRRDVPGRRTPAVINLVRKNK